VLVKIVLHLLDDPELKQMVEEEMGVFEQAMAASQGGMPPGAAPGGAPTPEPMPAMPGGVV
jgi:hypothetical protein